MDPKCEFIPVDFPEAHDTKEALKKFLRVAAPSAAPASESGNYSFLKALDESGWLQLVKFFLFWNFSEHIYSFRRFDRCCKFRVRSSILSICKTRPCAFAWNMDGMRPLRYDFHTFESPGKPTGYGLFSDCIAGSAHVGSILPNVGRISYFSRERMAQFWSSIFSSMQSHVGIVDEWFRADISAVSGRCSAGKSTLIYKDRPSHTLSRF